MKDGHWKIYYQLINKSISDCISQQVRHHFVLQAFSCGTFGVISVLGLWRFFHRVNVSEGRHRLRQYPL